MIGEIFISCLLKFPKVISVLSPSLKRAVTGCDSLFHVAADYRLWVPNPETMYDINVKGTEALILAAAEAGMERMIYTSSVATLGTNHDGTSANENTPSGLGLDDRAL